MFCLAAFAGAVAHAFRGGDSPCVTAIGASSMNQALKGTLHVPPYSAWPVMCGCVVLWALGRAGPIVAGVEEAEVVIFVFV